MTNSVLFSLKNRPEVYMIEGDTVILTPIKRRSRPLLFAIQRAIKKGK